MQLTINRLKRTLVTCEQTARDYHYSRLEARAFNRIAAIAAKYGYTKESDEVQGIITGRAPEDVRYTLLNPFDKKEWHATFNPADPTHIDHWDDTLVIEKAPWSLGVDAQRWGASRADVVRARMPEGWEETCDRVAIGREWTTFFSGDQKLVVFDKSGRRVKRGSSRAIWNAADAIKTHLGVEIDILDFAIAEPRIIEPHLYGTEPAFTLTKVDGKWTWPTRQAA